MPERANLSFPQGTELVFGPQASRRQYITDRLAEVMRGWGFSEIVLPGLDSDAAGDETELYHLTDREGRRLALRSDFTRVAAKALALELRRQPRQIGACYEGTVYRFAPSGHGTRVEHTQRGLEWVNARGAIFDAATLLIALECLAACGVQGAVIVIGHAGFVHAALGQGFDRRLLEAIDHKNPTRIAELCRRAGVPAPQAALLTELPLLTGGPEVFTRARALGLPQGAEAALSELEALHQLLAQCGASGLIYDLGEVRRFDYYSGFMFKAYHPQVGEELGGGGRYDRLFDRFGLSVPAVGLGFNIARLADATDENAYAANGQAIRAAGIEALKQAVAQRANGTQIRLEDA
ncbi:MAG: ATP phosphoribosyltransferase regulatory subunit [Planctomycetes bacterium]|nr:ATP phosphoribosyltransferase regulatory subunit [Planctomycetota bacterium]MCW8134806.1 ATP phosphoribosyltransferase regulatory subunit [Planctomycetota bacterium]